jgi:toxin FitB
MKYLLDTNVLSETVKPNPNKQVLAWLEKTPQSSFYVSVLTIGEIRKGIEKLPSGQKRQKLLYWLEEDLAKWFGIRLIPIGIEVAEKWGFLTAVVTPQLPAIDGLLAATALVHNFTLVTRNVVDFNAVPLLEIINPWE